MKQSFTNAALQVGARRLSRDKTTLCCTALLIWLKRYAYKNAAVAILLEVYFSMLLDAFSHPSLSLATNHHCFLLSMIVLCH